jgi:general secretion pathway protein G
MNFDSSKVKRQAGDSRRVVAEFMPERAPTAVWVRTAALRVLSCRPPASISRPLKTKASPVSTPALQTHRRARRHDFNSGDPAFTFLDRGFTFLDRGFTFLELIAAMTILLLLSTLALPIARKQVQREQEVELRRDLRDLRQAIDRYKDLTDRNVIPTKADTFGYPPDLQTLVDGVTIKGPTGAKYKFLRRIPIDPMTGKADWGLRAMQDDPDSTGWGGQNVFDVYCPSTATAVDGTHYSDW